MSVEITIPSPGESISTVSISAWLHADGAMVRKNDDLLEVESEKATLGVSAEVAGRLSILVPAGEDVAVGAVVGRIDPAATGEEPGKPAESAAVSQPAAAAAEASAPGTRGGVPSPAAAKLLEESGLKAADVAGTGPGGRITKQDVLAHQARPAAPAPATRPAAAVAPSAPAPAAPVADSSVAAQPASPAGRNERREPMSRLRQKVSERLVAVKNQTAMLSTFNEVDMSAIMDARKRYKELFQQKHEVGLGFMSFFTRAVTLALAEVPAVNAFIDGDELIYHDYCDVGVAVSAPKGLVVPVIRNAESLDLFQIEAEIKRLAERARTNKLTIDEMTGGTFTISNGGVFGSLMSTPILNPPQSGILGMHNIVDRPVALNGQVVIRPMMYLTLSYDHRIIDGRESVTFLVRVKQLLEDPMRMLLRV
ncbi:MAG: 2-oxoglutarate dehydrogenase complex dihydrolipoyllysine-residue succinyltransferase [Candidatus Delongbacteria bacterium]|nr:2-oxoglutarate dehydrogenase complex dihydrolipoyllysine-residue succinyltransferase [Candidatus Delongbacteria bacterium]